MYLGIQVSIGHPVSLPLGTHCVIIIITNVMCQDLVYRIPEERQARSDEIDHGQTRD